MKRVIAVIAASAALGFAAAPATAGHVIVNGDFEADPSGTTPPTGFTVEPGDEIVVVSGQAYITNAGGVGSSAAAANHFASFGSGDEPNISTLSQVLNTTIGQIYSLSFDYGVFGPQTSSQTLTVSIFNDDANLLINSFAVTDTGTNNLDTLFSDYSSLFTATSGRTRFSFSIAGQPTASVDALLDNVAVTAVPEPETWALLLLGFGAVGYSLRRRNSYRMAQAV